MHGQIYLRNANQGFIQDFGLGRGKTIAWVWLVLSMYIMLSCSIRTCKYFFKSSKREVKNLADRKSTAFYILLAMQASNFYHCFYNALGHT